MYIISTLLFRSFLDIIMEISYNMGHVTLPSKEGRNYNLRSQCFTLFSNGIIKSDGITLASLLPWVTGLLWAEVKSAEQYIVGKVNYLSTQVVHVCFKGCCDCLTMAVMFSNSKIFTGVVCLHMQQVACLCNVQVVYFS